MNFLEILIILFASINLLLARFALIRLHQPTTVPLWLIKVFMSAISPILFLFGLSIVIVGLLNNSLPAIVIGSCSSLLYLLHIIKVTQAPDALTGLEKISNVPGRNRIPAEKKAHFLPNRYVLRLPGSPDPIFEQNIPFYTIPDTNRHLLCDMWQPPKRIKKSGLVFIYLHGAAWAVLDKDYGTRTFFRHLAAQGHVIMDVAYRLFPETNFMGMVNDTKHAIAWIKANATRYKIDPAKIVIGGGSSGAHIALLAAYTNSTKLFTPLDLKQTDLSVRGVVSLYGQSDLKATYYHTCQHIIARSSLAQKEKNGPGGMPSWLQKSFSKNFHRLGFDKEVEPGMLAPMLGGSPAEKPEAYSLFSPIRYVDEDCPATLIIHGKQDILAPVNAICELHSRLRQAGVPVAMHLLPQTDHAFDLIMPKISPSAHNAIYDVERFLAMMAANEPVTGTNRISAIVSDESYELRS